MLEYSLEIPQESELFASHLALSIRSTNYDEGKEVSTTQEFASMIRFGFSAALICFTFANLAHGVLIYQIQDYPVWQQGHNLSGTITTTNTAPNDGLLMSAEILDWAFNVNGPMGFSAMMTATSPPPVSGDVGISPTQIMLAFPPLDMGSSSLQLSESSGINSGFLNYIMVNDISGAGIIEQYDAGVHVPPTIDHSWQTFPSSLGGNPWVIAQAVPEPSPFLLISLLSVLAVYRSRWQGHLPEQLF